MIKCILLLINVSILGLLLPFQAYAQTPENIQFLRVTPIIVDTTMLKGQPNEIHVTIDNLASFPMGIRLSLEGFDPDNLARLEPTVMSHWAHFSENEFILPEHTSKKVTLTLTPPGNTKDGGYYAVLYTTPIISTPLDTTRPRVVSKIGSLLFVTLGKQDFSHIEQKAKVQDFHVPFISTQLPITGTFTVKNAYFTHLKTKPILELKPLIGATQKILLEEKRVLPGRFRDWSISLPTLTASLYKATIRVSIGEGKQISAVTTFVYLPVPQHAPLVVGLLILLALLFLLRKRLVRAGLVLIGRSK